MMASLCASCTTLEPSAPAAALAINSHALSTQPASAGAAAQQPGSQQSAAQQSPAQRLAVAETCITNYKLQHAKPIPTKAGAPIGAAKPPTLAERRAVAACRKQAAEARASLNGHAKPKTKMARWLARTQTRVASARAVWVKPAAAAKSPAKTSKAAVAAQRKTMLRALAKAGNQTSPSNGATGRPAVSAAAPAGPLKPQPPTPSQAAALRTWAQDRLEAMQVTWSAQRAAIASASGELSTAVNAKQPDALDVLSNEVIKRLEGICPSPQGWSWQLHQEAVLPRPNSWQRIYRRFAIVGKAPVPVLGSTVELSIGPDEQAPGRLRVFALSTSCRGDLPVKPIFQQQISAQQAAASARLCLSQATGSTMAPTSAGKAKQAIKIKGGLRVAMIAGKPRLVWMYLASGDKGEHWVWVDAKDGKTINSFNTAAHLYTGTIHAQVRRPYQTGVAVGAVSNVDLLSKHVTSLHALYYTGSSNSVGDFTSESSIFGRKRYPRICGDRHCAAQDSAYLPSFTLNTDQNVATNPTYPALSPTVTQRRLEVLTALNHERHTAQLAFAGLPVVTPLYFDLPPTPSGCNGACCSDDSLFGTKPTLKLSGWCQGTGFNTAHDEALFRFMTYHEWGHSPLYAALGNHNPPKGSGAAGYSLLRAWWESVADHVALVMTADEQLRGGPGFGAGCGDVAFPGNTEQFFPDDRFGEDDCSTGPNKNPHDHGNNFVAIYQDLRFNLGWKDTFYRVFESVNEVGSTTTMSRTIGANSFYAEMMESDCSAWVRKPWQMLITQAWADHGSTVGEGAWTWTDQWPGAENPAFLRTTLPAADVTQWQDMGKPASYLPDNALEHGHDLDYAWVYLRQGILYRFRAWSPLSAPTDTKLRVVQINGGVEVTLAGNDDFTGFGTTGLAGLCGSDMPKDSQGNGLAHGLSSCLTFTPPTSGYYGVIVEGFDSTITGNYTWEYRALDDAGGGSDRLDPTSTTAALPISTGGDTYDMAWQYVGDYDWFRIHVPAGAAGATLHVEVCTKAGGGSQDSAAWLFRNATSMTVMAVNTNNATTCPGQGTRLDAVIPAGGDNDTWFVQAFEAGADATGSYTIRAWIDGLAGYQDDYWDPGAILTGAGQGLLTSPVMAAAQPISNDAATGRMIASHFHAAGDRDMFRVDLAEGEHVTFTTENLRGADTILELYADTTAIRGYMRIPDGSRRWLQRDDDGGLEPLASRIHFVAPRAGRYYIRVLPYSDGMTPEYPGSWTLHVQRMGNQAAALPQLP